ncbi:MAG: hypothetical protein ACTSQQ_02075, partial [Candidatus Helarchaeota archaeon]
PTKLQIEIEYPGDTKRLAATECLVINVEFDFLHQLWSSLGFILIGISLTIVSILYIKKTLSRRRLTNFSVE